MCFVTIVLCLSFSHDIPVPSKRPTLVLATDTHHEVGGKHFISINTQDILHMIENHSDSSEVVGTSCHSMFFGHHGVKGTLYLVGEHIFISDSTNQDQQSIIHATEFFSLCINDHHYVFVEEELFVVPSEPSSQ